MGMWIQYFSGQWGGDWSTWLGAGLAVVFFFLGSLGAYRHWQGNRPTALAMTTLVPTLTLLLIFYFNFKYRYPSAPPPPPLPPRVPHPRSFFIRPFPPPAPCARVR